MLTDLLSLPYILGVIGLGVGALTLPKKHWYRSAQVLFAVAALLADAKVIRWALTSENGINTRIGGCLLGLVVSNTLAGWVISKAQSDMREAGAKLDGNQQLSYHRTLISEWRRMITVSERKYKGGKEPGVSFAEIIQRQPQYLSLSPLLSSEAIDELEADKRPARSRRSPDTLRSVLAKEITRIETRLKLFPDLLPGSNEKQGPLLTFEVDTESGSSEITIGYADDDESVGLLEATIKMKFWNSNIHDALIKKLSISIFRKSTSIETSLAEESISKLTFRTGIGESRYFSGLTVPASSPTEDYWFRFVSYVRQDTVGDLDRDCVLRLTMVAARQESYSVDFPVSWQRAKEGNGYLLSPGMRL
jgi:hypothetical protein